MKKTLKSLIVKKIVILKIFLLKNLKSKVHALCMRINVCQQKHNAKKKEAPFNSHYRVSVEGAMNERTDE